MSFFVNVTNLHTAIKKIKIFKKSLYHGFLNNPTDFLKNYN